MIYKKIFYFVLLISVSLILIGVLDPKKLHATANSFVINEIMYDLETGSDSGREWIEVLNTSDSVLNLEDFKLFESGTAHTIKVSQGSATIPVGGFAVISDTPAKFIADNPGFSGNLFDSTFSLTNEGETISLKDKAGEIADTLSFSPTQGGAGDGSTLGKIGSAFTSTNPTPGLENTVFVTPPKDDASSTSTTTSSDPQDSSSENSSKSETSSSGSISTTYYPSPVVIVKEDQPFKVGAGRKRLVSIHTPILFSGLFSGGDTESAFPDSRISYTWSFGDGQQEYKKITEHTYVFPGEYNVVLVGESRDGTKVTSRTNVLVRDPNISIFDVSLGLNSSVAIKNNTKEEVNIGGWVIVSFDSSSNSELSRYAISRDTIISPGSTVRIGFKSPPADQINLYYPDGFLATSTREIHLDKNFFIQNILGKLAEISGKLQSIKN